MTQKIVTALDELNLVDRFLFSETMENPEAYQAAVEIITENEMEFLTRPMTEKELRISPQLRAVRLDVVNMGTDKTIYEVEMQQKNTYNLPKRSRYYQAQLDVSLLEPGCTDFNKLNDTCFILIAPFDIFGKGLYRYTFEGVCKECPDLTIKDGAKRMFINTKGTNREDFSQEFLDFMEYINSTTDETAAKSKSERIHKIHKNVQKIRKSEKTGVKFMQLWEEFAYARQEGLQQGREEGLEQGLEEGLEQGLAQGLEQGIMEGIKQAEEKSFIQRIRDLIEDHQEENIPMERTIEKLKKRFSMNENEAREYYQQYAK